MSSVRVGTWVTSMLLWVGCQSGALIDEDDTDTDTDTDVGVQEDGGISVAPASIDLGVVFVGQNATETLRVTNIGKKEADVRLEILGDATSEYVLSPYTSAPSPGDVAEHTLTLTPIDWGNKSVSVLIEDSISAGRIEVTVLAEVQVDQDGDGYGSEDTGGDDCDDTEASTYPDAEDTWYDGVDSDCEGNDDFDQDNDGYASAEYGGDDCDDTEASTYPGAEDTWYDGVDSDCEGNDDFDQDRDGYASSEYGGDDCEDENGDINPGVEDTWYDGVDSDCEGNDDFDKDRDGYVSAEYGGDDCEDDDAEINPGMTDTWYDGIDSDCDGANDFDQDGDGLEVDEDCDDTDATILGPVPETLDGTDEDCNGLVDDLPLADVVGASLYGPNANIAIGDKAKFMLGGDVDGDSVADLVAFSRGTTTGGSTDYGQAWIVSGADISAASGTIDSYDSTVVKATSYYYRFGNLSGPMEDIDDDGTDDLFASIYYYPSSGSSAGGSALLFSGADLTSVMDSGDNDANFTLGWGDATWVSDSGDFDGDGAVDVIVGSPLDNDDSKSDTGNVALFLGDGFAGDYDNGDVDEELHGDNSNDRFGHRVLLMDLNGDGYEDILASSPYNDEESSNGGAIYGVMGSASPNWNGDADAEADFIIYGDTSNLNLGQDTFPVLGDNDGDGRLDLVLASEASGDAWLFFEVGTFSGDYDVSDADHTFTGVDGDYASAVESHTDMDGDGDDEIVIGGDSNSTAGTYRGAIYRYDYDASWGATLSSTDANATIWGDKDNDFLGTGLTGGYDLTGDGKEDLLVGAVGSDGGATDGGGLFLVPGW